MNFICDAVIVPLVQLLVKPSSMCLWRKHTTEVGYLPFLYFQLISTVRPRTSYSNYYRSSHLTLDVTLVFFKEDKPRPVHNSVILQEHIKSAVVTSGFVMSATHRETFKARSPMHPVQAL